MTQQFLRIRILYFRLIYYIKVHTNDDSICRANV